MRLPAGRSALSQAIVILALVWLVLGPLPTRARAPLRFTGSSLVALGDVKVAWDTGRWWTLPDLSADDPGADPLLSNGYAHIDHALVSAAHVISRSLPGAVSLAWALMLVIGAAATSWSLRRLGVSAYAAWVAGMLFALCPFSLSRNTELFGLMPSFVPFAAFAAISLAMGRLPSVAGREWLIVIAGNVALGLNSIYYGWFGLFVVAIGTIAGFVRTRRAGSLKAGAAVLVALALATFVNLATTQARIDTGVPALQHASWPSDSELASVKLRALVTPMRAHWIDPFRSWVRRDDLAQFPPTAGRTALGLFGTLGLVALIVLVFVPAAAGKGDAGELARSASRLNLAVLLVATTGGFGSVVTALVAPGFTDYTMLVPFIAFFAIAGLSVLVDRLLINRREWLSFAWTAILIIGLFDQGLAFRRVTLDRAAVASDAEDVRDIVSSLEQLLPAGARVAQLPVQAPPRQHWGLHAFDQLKPFVMSRKLGWTFPPTTPEQQTWLEDTAGLELPALLARLRASGISAIVVDLLAYPNDGKPMLAALENSLSTPEPFVARNRYVAFDIREH